jgi:hypothetical protein
MNNIETIKQIGTAIADMENHIRTFLSTTQGNLTILRDIASATGMSAVRDLIDAELQRLSKKLAVLPKKGQ